MYKHLLRPQMFCISAQIYMLPLGFTRNKPQYHVQSGSVQLQQDVFKVWSKSDLSGRSHIHFLFGAEELTKTSFSILEMLPEIFIYY